VLSLKGNAGETRHSGASQDPKRRHPEVRAERASKDDDSQAASFEGRFAATTG
jgi:hypothetical protein